MASDQPGTRARFNRPAAGTNSLSRGVGGGVGVEAGGFGGLAVGHGSREDQVGKGYFLVGDWVVDFVLWHE
jgi:hypothetical protein